MRPGLRRQPVAIACAALVAATLVVVVAPLRALDPVPGPVARHHLEVRSDWTSAFPERILHRFDFDEPHNPLPIPDLWYRLEGSDFPRWNRGDFVPGRTRTTVDAAPPRSADAPPDRAYELETRGGSAGIRLVPGVLPVVPEVDYLVGVRMRTLDLERAAGRIAVRLLGEDHARLDVESRSDPVRTDGTWENVFVVVSGHGTGAAWLEIDLLLEQPDPDDPSSASGPRRPGLPEPQPPDVEGRVQFDDLVIWRLPRMRLAARPASVTPPGVEPVVSIRVGDAGRERLAGRLRVRDHHGRLVEEHPFRTEEAVWSTEVVPTLPGPGWYRLELELLDDDHRLVSTTLDLVTLAARERPEIGASATPGPAFTILVDEAELARDSGVGLPGRMAWLGTRSVLVAARPAVAAVHPEWFRRLDDLLARHEVSIHLRRGGSGEASAGPDDPRAAPESWLAALGHAVRRWRIDTRRDDADILALLDRFVSGGTLLVPAGRAARPVPGFPAGEARTAVQPFVRFDPEDAIDADATEAPSVPPPPLVRLGPTGPADDSDAVAATARRLLRLAHASSAEIGLPAPWRFVHDRDGIVVVTPDPRLPVYRTIADRLAGRSARGSVDLGPGIEALIFDGPTPDDGLLAMWREPDHATGRIEPVTLELHLGHAPVRATDLMGRTSVVPVSESRHRITLDHEPVLLEDIDVRLARFRAGVSIEPDFVSADAGRRTHEVVLENPWSVPMSGSLRFLAPRHWSFTPTRAEFALAAGETARIPVDIAYPAFETAGPKSVVIGFRLDLDVPTTLEVARPVRVGHDHVVLEPDCRLEPRAGGGPDDVVVTVACENRGPEPIWLTLFVVAPDRPMERTPIGMLQPGQRVAREFRFPGRAEAWAGREVRVGFDDDRTAGRLSRLVVVPDS